MLARRLRPPIGDVAGPWTRIADQRKLAELAAPPSAVSQAPTGQACRPGTTTSSRSTRPNAKHVYLGLEEVYETEDGGATWKTVGPVLELRLRLLGHRPTRRAAARDRPTPTSTRSPSPAARSTSATTAACSRRPLAPGASAEDALGHATDWMNHNDGLRTLQYYSVGTGRGPGPRRLSCVAGGLQDNGGSLLRGRAPTSRSVPFGGDGGDIIVNPRNGCQILDEYVFLTLWLTKNCGQSDGTTSADLRRHRARRQRRGSPRRSGSVRGSKNIGDGASERWVAGGNSFWRARLGVQLHRGAGRRRPGQGLAEASTP